MAHKRDHENGFILIAVLLLVALLAALLAGVLQMSSGFVVATAVYSDMARADELGRTAPDLLVQQILGHDPDAKRGGSFVAHLKDADIFVDYLAETARVDVNKSPPEFFVSLFKAAGVDPAQAELIGEKIKTWRAQSAPADKSAPSSGPSPASPTPAASASPDGSSASATGQPGSANLIEHEALIAEAWDISPTLLKKLSGSLTIANPSGKVDPILANTLIVTALFDGRPLQAEDFLRRRERGFTTEGEAVMAVPSETQANVGFSAAQAYRAKVRIKIMNRSERSYEMIVAPPSKRGDPVKTIAWRAL